MISSGPNDAEPMYTGNRMMYHKDKKMADGCNKVDKSKERMDVARYAGGVLGNRCGNDLSRSCQFSDARDSKKKSLRRSDKMGRQTRAGRTDSPDVARKPLGEGIHKLLVLNGRSRWRRSNRRDLLPRGLLGDDMVCLTVLRLLIVMICVVRLPTQIGVCRIDGGFSVITGDGTIYEVCKWGGSNGSDGAGARVILVGVW